MNYRIIYSLGLASGIGAALFMNTVIDEYEQDIMKRKVPAFDEYHCLLFKQIHEASKKASPYWTYFPKSRIIYNYELVQEIKKMNDQRH